MEDGHNISPNIELTGFREIDESSMVILKKSIDKQAKKISGICKNMQRMHITLKAVHEREKSEKYDIHAKVVDIGRVYVSEVTERNLFAAVDGALQKILHEMHHK